MIMDENTQGVLQTDDYLILPHFPSCSDVTFKASFLVASDVVCSGKITALFDLFVIGDITAEEVEVKGKLVCTGKCHVTGAITVQNEIWVDEIAAENIESHDHIVAQEIDGTYISSEGSIVIAKTMAVERMAKSKRNILCGETAYGAGKVIAHTIITGEPIDLDDGEEGLVSPQVYLNEAEEQPNNAKELSSDFKAENNFKGYIDALIGQAAADLDKIRLLHWRSVLCQAQEIAARRSTQYRNIEMLLWLTEIVNSNYFKDWNTIHDWYRYFLNFFTRLACNEPPDEPDPAPAKKLLPGDIVRHSKYGTGRVSVINNTAAGTIATVHFSKNVIKSFVITANTMTHFQVLAHGDASRDGTWENYAASIKCEIHNYTDWIRALQVLNLYGAAYGKELFDITFDLVSSNLGLRSKFVSDRLLEKGWNIHV